MSYRNINRYTSVQQTDQHIHIQFSSPQRVLSSAILNGGFTQAEHIVNLKVPSELTTNELPTTTLQNYANAQHWQSKTIGMMTAASMNSLRINQANIEGVELAVLVPTGLNNARRAGDKADVSELLATPTTVGTINLVLVCSAQLTDAAMVEALTVMTEAKAAALQTAQVLSPVSNQLATGTGTDAIAIVSGNDACEIAYCGKHILLGEVIGQLTINAITQSIQSKKAA